MVVSISPNSAQRYMVTAEGRGVADGYSFAKDLSAAKDKAEILVRDRQEIAFERAKTMKQRTPWWRLVYEMVRG